MLWDSNGLFLMLAASIVRNLKGQVVVMQYWLCRNKVLYCSCLNFWTCEESTHHTGMLRLFSPRGPYNIPATHPGIFLEVDFAISPIYVGHILHLLYSYLSNCFAACCECPASWIKSTQAGSWISRTEGTASITALEDRRLA